MAVAIDVEDEFIPTAKQARLLSATTKFRAYLGGLGSGKTASGAVAMRNCALLNAGVVSVVAAPTYAQARDVCLPELLRWSPRDLIRRTNESMTGGLWVDWINGHRTMFRSVDKPGTLRGLNLAGAWLDEAARTRAEAFVVLNSRIRDPRARFHWMIITSSPNGTRNWLADKFRQTQGDPNWTWTRAASYENPHTGRDYIRDLTASVSRRGAREEIEGEFVGSEGSVYGGDFSPALHIVDYDFDPGRPVYLGIDFGFRQSALLAFQQRREDGAWVCFDEEMPESLGAKDLAKIILEKPYRSKIVGAVHDPAALNNDQATGAPLVAILQDEAGLACEAPEERKIPRGIETVRFNLAPYRGTPRLFFARRLRALEEARDWTRGVLRDVEAYHYPEDSTGEIPEHDDTSHSMDALRYFCLVKAPVGGLGGTFTMRRM